LREKKSNKFKGNEMSFDPKIFKNKNGFDLELTRLKNKGLEFTLKYYLMRKCIRTFL